jgi:hypothetical protein
MAERLDACLRYEKEQTCTRRFYRSRALSLNLEELPSMMIRAIEVPQKG